MAEPTSTGALAVGIAGAGVAGVMAGFDGAMAVGSLCGALIYFASAKELTLGPRLMYFAISWVMGYLAAPAVARAELFGLGPIELPALAAFICSALIVTVTLAAIRQRRGVEGNNG
ncbi:putative holin [Stutzerimonas nitrititolerans]|uniref:Phage holin n=1 Tax=Stutzerimonas nitrititolerans TaxID=2482751 RepID=A0ABX9USU4_9GAMM|nr:putative holin [Stutzerimonas nitrititolerans]RMH96410.1 hypothetical protein EA795_20065 [Stutzerimonas nitrititolerans]